MMDQIISLKQTVEYMKENLDNKIESLKHTVEEVDKKVDMLRGSMSSILTS